MSESTLPSPSGGRTAAANPAGIGGRIFAALCWLALLCAVLVIALASYVRLEHGAETERQAALSAEQRRVASATRELVHDLERGSLPMASDVSVLRERSLGVLARLHPGPPNELEAAWSRLATGLDLLHVQWARILEFQVELDALRDSASALRDAITGLARRPADGEADSTATASREVLVIVSGELARVLERASLADPALLDRAGTLFEACARVLDSFATMPYRTPAFPALRADRTASVLHGEVPAAAEMLDATGRRLAAARGTAAALAPASSELRNLAASSTAVVALLPDHEAEIGHAPAFLGVSIDAWLIRSAGLGLAALLGLFWRLGRLLRLEAAGLDAAWAEAAESDWRARGIVRDLVRAIDSLDRRRSRRSSADDDWEDRAREASVSLRRIVARRSQLAAALLSAREPLRKRLAAARDAVLAHLDTSSGDPDLTPLVEVESTFREATLFAMAALVGEIRAVASRGASAGEAGGPGGDPVNGSETVRDVAGRGFELLERCLERVLAGEEEEHAALVFLIDDLRVVQGRTPFSLSLDFNPDLPSARETGPRKDDSVLRIDAARMLPPFRKGVEEWTAATGDGSSAARLIRGSVSVLARAAEERNSPTNPFWSVAAAFFAALCDGAIPAGPAVRRMVNEVAREFGATAEREHEPSPSDELLRKLLIYITLADSDDPEIEAVRAAFHLDRYPLAIPEDLRAARSAEEERGEGVSEEIIQQLEGIRAALDRINAPSDASSTPTPSC